MNSCNDRKFFILLFGGRLFCFVCVCFFFGVGGGLLFELLLLRGSGGSFLFLVDGSLFVSTVGLRYPLSSLFWPLHFKWPLKACQ